MGALSLVCADRRMHELQSSALAPREQTDLLLDLQKFLQPVIGTCIDLQVKYIKEKGKDNTWVLRYKLLRRPNQVSRPLGAKAPCSYCGPVLCTSILPSCDL